MGPAETARKEGGSERVGWGLRNGVAAWVRGGGCGSREATPLDRKKGARKAQGGEGAEGGARAGAKRTAKALASCAERLELRVGPVGRAARARQHRRVLERRRVVLERRRLVLERRR